MDGPQGNRPGACGWRCHPAVNGGCLPRPGGPILRYNGVGPVQHGRLAAADRSREETNMINKGLAAAIALILAMPAIADEATPDHPQGRYTFNKVADGFLRLDTQTGEVALCS